MKPGGGIWVRQQTNCDRAPDPVGTMDTDGTDRIIYMQFQIQDLDDNDDQNARNDTDDACADGIKCITACCHSHQAG